MSMTREGYGFVEVPDRDTDIFVPQHKMRGALNGDIVKVLTTKAKGVGKDGKPKRIEGEIITVLERSSKPHIGVLQISRGEAWLIMESRNMPYDISIPLREIDRWFGKGGLLENVRGETESVDSGSPASPQRTWKPGDVSGLKAAVIVTDWPRKAPAPVGRIVDVLGEPGANDTEMHAILAEYGLPYRFEPEVEAAAEAVPDKITPKDIAERRDFRKVTTFTIDPADAKDFDDALSYRELEDGNIEVGVHIADVTHYVTPGSIIDKCAYERGTSVYLVDRTVPMLPEKLSNNLCSLRPGEEKLCFSAVFDIAPTGTVKKTWLGRTVIKSDYRFNYDEAQAIIETGQGPLAKEIQTLHKIASAFRKKRFTAGAIAFERPEMKVEVDETGKPIRVYEKISKEANWLIEEFMLLANRAVAEYVGKVPKTKKAKTFVYRVHEDPNEEKLGVLRKFVRLFGYDFPMEPGAMEDGQKKEEPKRFPEGVKVKEIKGKNVAQRIKGPSRGGGSGDDGPALHGPCPLHNRQCWPLRTGIQILHPLHLTYQKISRHDGAPSAGHVSGRGGVPEQGILRDLLSVRIPARADSHRGRAFQHQVQALRVRPDRVGPVRGDRAGQGGGHGACQGHSRRLLPVRRGDLLHRRPFPRTPFHHG